MIRVVYIMVALYSDGGVSSSEHPDFLACQAAARHVAHTDFEELKRDERGDVMVPLCASRTERRLR